MSTRGRWGIGAVVGASLLVVLFLTLRPSHNSSSASVSPTTTAPRLAPVESVGPGPTTEHSGMPAGFARSEDGARAAAMAYASASQRWMYFEDDGVKAAVAAIATHAAAPRLTAEVVSVVRAAREGLTASAGRVWWIVRPLATRVESHRADAARVSVWVVTVLSASDAAMPQSDWRTVSIELQWERGDWRVAEIQDRPGPTPMLGQRDHPWQPEQLDDALDGFTRVDVGER